MLELTKKYLVHGTIDWFAQGQVCSIAPPVIQNHVEGQIIKVASRQAALAPQPLDHHSQCHLVTVVDLMEVAEVGASLEPAAAVRQL